MTHDLLPICAGVLASCSIACIEHAYTFHLRLAPLIRYTLGVGAIGGGLTLTGALSGEWFSVLQFWITAIATGLVVTALHLWRAWRGDVQGDVRASIERGRDIGHLEERIDGISRSSEYQR